MLTNHNSRSFVIIQDNHFLIWKITNRTVCSTWIGVNVFEVFAGIPGYFNTTFLGGGAANNCYGVCSSNWFEFRFKLQVSKQHVLEELTCLVQWKRDCSDLNTFVSDFECKSVFSRSFCHDKNRLLAVPT